MKKWTKSVLVTVLSAVFLLGCMGTAWATLDGSSNFTQASDDADVSSFYLIKDYRLENAGGSSPQETFTFTITPYAVWNAGSGINNTNMPMLKSSSTATETSSLALSTTPSKGYAQTSATTGSKVEVFLPNYTTVGDYWYQVVETKGVGGNPTTGVLYGTNSSAVFGSNPAYYIHVQVTNGTPLIRNVTMHTSCPATNTTNANYNNLRYNTEGSVTKSTEFGTKVNAIENKYQAGTLTITKAVTGNGGDKTKYFPVTVTFNKESGTVVNSDITFTAPLLNGSTYTSTSCTIWGQNDATNTGTGNLHWKDTATPSNDIAAGSTDAATASVTFYVTDNSTVTFSNIPYGITYTVTEDLTADDAKNYSNTFVFDNTSEAGDTVTVNPAAGAIDTASGKIDDAGDTLNITNTKNVTIDIGVITEDAPYVALMAVCAGAAVLMVTRKKRIFED